MRVLLGGIQAVSCTRAAGLPPPTSNPCSGEPAGCEWQLAGFRPAEHLNPRHQEGRGPRREPAPAQRRGWKGGRRHLRRAVQPLLPPGVLCLPLCRPHTRQGTGGTALSRRRGTRCPTTWAPASRCWRTLRARACGRTRHSLRRAAGQSAAAGAAAGAAEGISALWAAADPRLLAQPAANRSQVPHNAEPPAGCGGGGDGAVHRAARVY